MANIITMILEIIKKLIGMKGASPSTPAPVTAERVPPATDPNKYRDWLQNEVAKKGQPPHGYEPTGEAGSPGRKTFCNFFVRSVLKNIYGWTGFETQSTDQAGEMTDYMNAHPQTWKKLDGTFVYKIKGVEQSKEGPDYEVAAQYAAQGCLVVAAWKNPDYPKTSPTGHVCVVAPENQLMFSNKWGRTVAMAANVGSSNWYGKGLSFAFGEKEPGLYLFLGA
jgi:hypothetical protein